MMLKKYLKLPLSDKVIVQDAMVLAVHDKLIGFDQTGRVKEHC